MTNPDSTTKTVSSRDAQAFADILVRRQRWIWIFVLISLPAMWPWNHRIYEWLVLIVWAMAIFSLWRSMAALGGLGSHYRAPGGWLSRALGRKPDIRQHRSHDTPRNAPHDAPTGRDNDNSDASNGNEVDLNRAIAQLTGFFRQGMVAVIVAVIGTFLLVWLAEKAAATATPLY